jgi:hypothetical protein
MLRIPKPIVLKFLTELSKAFPLFVLKCFLFNVLVLIQAAQGLLKITYSILYKSLLGKSTPCNMSDTPSSCTLNIKVRQSRYKVQICHVTITITIFAIYI